MQSFSSEDKIKVRLEDFQLIKELSSKASRKLTYLGLPSPWMGDVTLWEPYLEQVYAVERERNYLSHLMDKAYVLGFYNRFSYFYGDIDNMSKTGMDDSGKPLTSIFPVDLINLDYCEGLDYREFRKIGTLENMIKAQNQSLKNLERPYSFPYFILFLTHNIPLREGNPKAKQEYLKYLTKDISLFEEALKGQIQNSLDWYLSPDCPAAYPHKCFVMGKLFEFAQVQEFKAVPKKIIQYKGDKGAIMMHYQFHLTPVKVSSMVPVNNKMNIIDIMNYPIKDANGQDLSNAIPLISTL